MSEFYIVSKTDMDSVASKLQEKAGKEGGITFPNEWLTTIDEIGGDSGGDEPVTTYTVTFDVNGEKPENPPDDLIVEAGGKIVEPEPLIYDRASFMGWTRTQNGSDFWDFENDVVTEDITLYAYWEY